MKTIGEDYIHGPYSITFPAGVTIVPVNIAIINDNVLEGDEDFTLVLNSSSVPDAVTVSDNNNQSTVTILDDDRK